MTGKYGKYSYKEFHEYKALIHNTIPTPRQHPLCTRQTPAQPATTYHTILSRAQQCIVTQQAIKEKSSMSSVLPLWKLMKFVVGSMPTMCEHYANPMVHLITGKTISSSKK